MTRYCGKHCKEAPTQELKERLALGGLAPATRARIKAELSKRAAYDQPASTVVKELSKGI